MFANEFRRAIETAPRMKLTEVGALMWRAWADRRITEAEAEELSNLIELRKVVPPAEKPPRTSVGSSPRSDGSMERRRRWAAAGRLPPALAAKFTQAEVAILAVVADTVVRLGDCRRCIDQIGAIAGVCRTSVKKALRKANALGLVTIEERRRKARRNLPNIVRIVCPEWEKWNALARRPFPEGGGVKSATPSNTVGYRGWEKRGFDPSKRLPRRQSKGSDEEPDANPGVWQEPPGAGDKKSSPPA